MLLNNTDVAVSVSHLKKAFKLPNEQSTGIKQLLINKLKGKKGYEIQRVLKDISFDVKKGEFFGIVGRNGSGKSTLLKLLSEIYTPDSGSVKVNGSLTPFIELGVGFNPELTGRENVFLNGALLGFSKQEMDSMYDDIVGFAELEKFMDQKLKNYSSGMQVRLAFSIAIRADTDILILDEVLAVGDQAFQQKCFDYFEDLKRKQKTVILVTHDMSAVKQFCDRALMLESGKVKTIGVPHEVSLEYEKSNFPVSADDTDRADTKTPIVAKNKNNKPSRRFQYSDEIRLSISWPKEMNVCALGFILSKNGEHVFATNTLNQNVDLSKRQATLVLRPRLGDGVYKVTAGLFGESRHDILAFVDGPDLTIFDQPLLGVRDEEWHGLTYTDNEWV